MEIYYLKSIRKDGEMNKINKLMKFKLWDIDNIESEIYYKNLELYTVCIEKLVFQEIMLKECVKD